MRNKAVFLDRDGTLIFDYGYIKDPDKVEILPEVLKALDILSNKNFMLFIVTNQSGIGRGLMTVGDVEAVNNRMIEIIGKNKIKDILICPHSPDENCSCRKPKTELVDIIVKKYDIDLTQSYSIGDKDCDRDIGFDAGGFGIKLGENGIENLLDAVNFIIKRDKEER